MILNIYKPKGISSFSVVKAVKRITREKKVGHGGTLDPFAEGVLIVGTGKDTKVLGSITNHQKSYEASLILGKTTNTLDPEGEIISANSVPDINENQIISVLNSFIGFTYQIPPMFSAKKVNGIKLYKLARKNIEIPRKPIEIHIEKISLIEYSSNRIKFFIKCSKGTYIRVVGKDIAEKLGTIGYLETLIRKSVGKYSLDDAQTIEDLQGVWK